MDCKGKWFCEFLQTFGVILIVNLRFKFRYVKFVVEITFILLSFCFKSVSFCYNVTVAVYIKDIAYLVIDVHHPLAALFPCQSLRRIVGLEFCGILHIHFLLLS